MSDDTKPEVKTSSDAFRLIHGSLARWIEGALECGFDDDPMMRVSGQSPDGYAGELIKMAQLMSRIEQHTDVGEDTP